MEAATGEAAAKVRSNPKMRQTHRKLRIVGGSKAKKLLLSPKDANVRPMMEKVRSAVFNLLSARFGGGALMPEGTRWLDMFGGTGAVGIEAISRGVEHATFVELDRWVVKTILKANIHACDFQDKAQVLNMKAEDFLKRSIDYPHYAGKPFDFISVCPPYQLVSYPELFDLLSRSPLVHSKTYILVEYPKQLKEEIPDQITTVLGGVLPKFRDRSYGRTWLAVYGPTESDSVRINPNRYDDKIVGKSSGEDKNEHGGEQSPDTSNGDDRSA
jgi:16S rRNA (guanine(966)-N(2))-methyltransferase RsmD